MKKKKKIIKLGREYLKAWVEILLVGVFQGRFTRESLIRVNFPGGSFQDAEENIFEEFSGVHAFILIFIRKIFILQTHSLHVYSHTNNNVFLLC